MRSALYSWLPFFTFFPLCLLRYHCFLILSLLLWTLLPVFFLCSLKSQVLFFPSALFLLCTLIRQQYLLLGPQPCSEHAHICSTWFLRCSPARLSPEACRSKPLSMHSIGLSSLYHFPTSTFVCAWSCLPKIYWQSPCLGSAFGETQSKITYILFVEIVLPSSPLPKFRSFFLVWVQKLLPSLSESNFPLSQFIHDTASK